MSERDISAYVKAYLGKRKVRQKYKTRTSELGTHLKNCESQAQARMRALGEDVTCIGPVVWNDRAHYIRNFCRTRPIKYRDLEEAIGSMTGPLAIEAIVEACHRELGERTRVLRSGIGRSPPAGQIEAPDEECQALVFNFCELESEKKELARSCNEEARGFTEAVAELKGPVLTFLERKGDEAPPCPDKVVRSKRIGVETRSGGPLEMTILSTTTRPKRAMTLNAMRKQGVVEAALAEVAGLAAEDGTFDTDDPAVKNALITAIREAWAAACAAAEPSTRLSVKIK